MVRFFLIQSQTQGSVIAAAPESGIQRQRRTTRTLSQKAREKRIVTVVILGFLGPPVEMTCRAGGVRGETR